MERVEYDPEIDPSIRQERESAERERELTARIRLEIERYVEERDLVPREHSSGPDGHADAGTDTGARNLPEIETETETEAGSEGVVAGESRREKRRHRSRQHLKTVRSVFSGSILSSDWMRRMWPYLLGVAVLLVLYIAHTFHLQKLHLDQQNLQREVRELDIRAVEKTADRVRATRRSEIVRRLEQSGIPVEEFPNPVKTVEKR